MTQKKDHRGRQPLNDKAMTSTERGRKLRAERIAAGLKEEKVWLMPAETAAAVKRFGCTKAEALAAAVRAAIAAPIQEADGQITLLSDRMKVDEARLEVQKALDRLAAVEKENERLRKALERR